MAFPYQKHVWVTKEIIRREYLQNISDGIFDEQQDRLIQEALIRQDLADEEARAKGAENQLRSDLSDEISRAQLAESTLTNDLLSEYTRAVGEETELSERISNEYTRATGMESALQTSINNLAEKVTIAYKASGSIYFSELPELTSQYLGCVYDIKDDFTTTSDFIEGAGKDYPAGTNVAIIARPNENYSLVTPTGNEDPSEEGWYEYVNNVYVLTADTSVVSGKNYYVLSISQTYYYDAMTGSFSEGFYLEQDNITLSASQPTSVTFTDVRILSSSMVDAYTTVDGLDYSSMVTTTGSCVITYPEQDSAITVSIKIWVR